MYLWPAMNRWSVKADLPNEEESQGERCFETLVIILLPPGKSPDLIPELADIQVEALLWHVSCLYGSPWKFNRGVNPRCAYHTPRPPRNQDLEKFRKILRITLGRCKRWTMEKGSAGGGGNLKSANPNLSPSMGLEKIWGNMWKICRNLKKIWRNMTEHMENMREYEKICGKYEGIPPRLWLKIRIKKTRQFFPRQAFLPILNYLPDNTTPDKFFFPFQKNFLFSLYWTKQK